MDLSLRLLRVFYAVAQAQSFTKAAEGLGVTQPAVSKNLRELECRVGMPLLVRTPRGITLTEAGERLLAHARVMLAAARAAGDDLAALHGLTRGTLRIGASSTIATYLLPEVLHVFNQRYPDVELRLTSAPTRAIAGLLVDHELDVALVEAPVRDPRITADFWRADELVVVAHPEHPFARAGVPIPASALADQLMVMREPGAGTRDIIEAALKRAGVRLRRVLDADSTEAIKQIVAAGFGMAIVSRAAIVEPLALRRLVVLDMTDVRIERPLDQLSLRDGWQSAAARAFADVLRAMAPRVRSKTTHRVAGPARVPRQEHRR